MSAQLFQLLGQLDRPGATEIVIATGRQVAVRINSVYQMLTASAVTLPQLLHLIGGTPLVAMVPSVDHAGDPVMLEIDGRALCARFHRQGKDILLRIEPRPAPQPAARSPLPPAAPGHESGHARAASRTGEIAISFAPTPSHGTSLPMASIAARTFTPRSPAQVQSVATTTSIPSSTPSSLLSSLLSSLPSSTPSSTPSPAARTPPPRVPAGLLDEPSDVVPALVKLVTEARRRDATDLHVAADRPVLVREVGNLIPLDAAPRSPAEVEDLLLPLLGPVRRRQLAERGYVDLAIDVPGAGRLRANVSRHHGGLKGAFRLAVTRPPMLDALGLPAAVARVTTHHQGLVVIAGPSGHGKTTTLAALVDLLNRARPIHIVTIEDPVEIVHPRHVAVVSQREVGRHTESFATALEAALREDPDVIVIGELRDRETVEIALTAAETGHLVLATMSTPSAARTIDRLIDMFPPAEQPQARASLGAALKAIVAQRLLPDARGTGVVVAVELLVGVLALANLIRDNKLFQLPNLLQLGRGLGMLRLDDSLLELVRAGKLAEDVALRHADNKQELSAALHPGSPDPARRGGFSRRDRA